VRFVGWNVIGLALYFVYGRRRSDIAQRKAKATI
jgi:hypothetical protein